MGFSGGSSLSYTYLDFDYFPDRGGDPSRLFECSSGLSRASQCATGIAIPGIPTSVGDLLQPEGIGEYDLQRRWQWHVPLGSIHGVSVTPVPHEPQAHPKFSSIKSSVNPVNTSAIVLSPAAQLPTPASMAVLLNPNSQSERRPTQDSFQQPPSSSANLPLPPPAMISMTQVTTFESEKSETLEGVSREKKHGCTMCHKR